MKMYVCVKHVPDTAANIRTLGGNAFDETVKFIMNPYDEYALEEALRIRTRTGDGEVVAVTAGREGAAATLRSALAMGADRAILVKTGDYFIDSIETARLLHAAIAGDGCPDLVLTGRQSIDAEGMQTPYRLAALFDFPVAVNVVSLSIAGGVATVERETESDIREVIEMSLPGVIGATRGLNLPRSATLPDIMKARKKEIRVVDGAGPGTPADSRGAQVRELQPAPDRGKGRILAGDPGDMVRDLLRFLRDEARVLRPDR